MDKVALSVPYRNRLGWRNHLMRMLWGAAYWTLFRPTPDVVFWQWRVVVLRLFGARIGHGCKIRSAAKIWAPWHLVMGDRVAIGPSATIYNVDTITLCSKTCVSQGAYLCTASHDITRPGNPLITAPIRVESFAWVAADAFVGMGVTIGEGAVVGARAAVFKDVEPWTVVGGNPAKFIKKRIIKE